MRKRRFISSENEEKLIETSMHLAIEKESLDLLANAIKESPDSINTKNLDKKTPLDLALSNANIAASEMLVERGANLNICNREGLTPLHQLIKNVESFILKSVSTDSIVSLTQKIIDKGASLSIQDRRGNTLINYVAQKAKANKKTTKVYNKIGKLLLSNDKSVTETVQKSNNMGKTPMDYLSRNGNVILRDLIFNSQNQKNSSEAIAEIIAKAEISAKKSADMEKIEA